MFVSFSPGGGKEIAKKMEDAVRQSSYLDAVIGSYTENQAAVDLPGSDSAEAAVYPALSAPAQIDLRPENVIRAALGILLLLVIILCYNRMNLPRDK